MQSLPNSGGGPMDYAHLWPRTALPLLALGDDLSDVGEIDYSAFLQDQQDMQDVDYLAEESSGSTTDHRLTPTSPSSGTAPEPSLPLLAPRQASEHLSPSTALAARPRGNAGRDSSTSSGGQGGSNTQGKQRLERRGHTKSRRGCFNCKRRRIKCQETRPACPHCVKQGLKCEYPAMPTIVHQPQHQVPIFSLQDMRFFQHFLLNCYPHHPIGSEAIWTHEIPCLSQKYEYLMHAILGYSASELMATTDPSLAEAAMTHRLKAIKAIQRALSTTPITPNCKPPSAPSITSDLYEEGNALMATCFALTYQSVLLADGMAEYMTFIRGIVLVAIGMYCKGAKMLFGEMLGEKQKEMVQPFMEVLGLIDQGWVERAVRGVEGLRGLVEVEGREVEKKYWELIAEIAKMLSVNSWKAYVALTEHYGWWTMLAHEKFRRLVDPTNQVAILLGAHWIALEQIMAVICEAERRGAKNRQSGAGASLGSIGWLRYLNGQVDAEHQAYNWWPMWVEAQLEKDRGFFGKT